MQLENELKSISDLMQLFVDDLNGGLSEKIARIQELEEELKTQSFE